MMEAFAGADLFEQHATPRQGLGTTDNGRFVRAWAEISFCKVGFGYANKSDARDSEKKWFPYSKGGGFRRWFGNDFDVINWENDGVEIRENLIGKNPNIPRSESHYFKEGITWGLITSANFSARLSPQGGIFDVGGSKAFPQAEDRPYFLGYLNSNLSSKLLKVLNPTLNFQVGDLKRLPIKGISDKRASVTSTVNQLISFSKSDWDAYETSWDFTTLALLSPDHRFGTLEATYAHLRAHWASMTAEMQRLEEENNRIFIDAYGLQDELTPEVPIEQITLTCNPAYSIKGDMTDEPREGRLLERTMKELISYAIGCMFGRYSLDAPGLILANQGDTVQTYLDRIPNPTFAPDRDNVIPLFEEDWFADDAYQRFREFLSVTFGAERLVENLEFMRGALGKEVRTYLAKDFYADHVQRYKKRPIYWLVSSPKGAFQALIYMHRYTPDTLNITLNDYVRGLRDRLEAALRAAKATEISPDATPAEKNRAKRDIDRFTKQIAEVTEWERDTLYPLAVERIRIDLDDGVKRNYPRFPGVLRPIKGLEDEDA